MIELFALGGMCLVVSGVCRLLCLACFVCCSVEICWCCLVGFVSGFACCRFGCCVVFSVTCVAFACWLCACGLIWFVLRRVVAWV